MLEELRPKLLGQSLVIPGVCRLAVATTSSVGIKDPQKLLELLGDKFDALSHGISSLMSCTLFVERSNTK